MKHRKSVSTISYRKSVYAKTVERSAVWAGMTVDELKGEYLALGNTPALVTEDRDQCLRWLYLSAMKRLVGD